MLPAHLQVLDGDDLVERLALILLPLVRPRLHRNVVLLVLTLAFTLPLFLLLLFGSRLFLWWLLKIYNRYL